MTLAVVRLTYQSLNLAMAFFEVKATSGDNKLGGDDFDDVIMDYLVAEFKKRKRH